MAEPGDKSIVEKKIICNAPRVEVIAVDRE